MNINLRVKTPGTTDNKME